MYIEAHTNICTLYWRYAYVVYFLPTRLWNITLTT
jgi:hypothetical protein